jgi:hypothetical protein
MDEPKVTEHFVPFPAEKRAELESRKVPGEIHNPHHPNNRKSAPAHGNVNNPHHPSNRMAAQGMTVSTGAMAATAPSVPTLTGQQRPLTHPQMERPMAAPVDMSAHGFDVPVNANSELEAVSMALPSNFFYYNFKEVYIKPFKGGNFSKLNRAREEESLLHVVEAVSSVISTPTIPKGVAFYLTLPDFYSVLYWLRLHSFLKHAFVHQTMCRSKIHHGWVEAGGRKGDDGSFIEVLPDSLKHAETISKATLVTKVHSEPIDVSKYPLDYQGIELVPATMQEILEITMNDNIDRFDARIAASIQPIGQRIPLVQRMSIVAELSADDIATVQQYERDVSDYGVDEHIKWRCKTCGHLHTDEVQLEAHSFFPSAA